MSASTGGRPRRFDEAEVIDRAVEVFWARGGVDTTMRVLERELDVRQSSLYNAFGSKQQLLHRCVDRYLERVEAELLAPFASPTAGIDDVIALVTELTTWMSNRSHPGCMLLNLVAEQGGSDAVVSRAGDRYRRRLLEALTPPLAGSPSRAELVVTALYGMHARARAGATAADLATTRDAIVEQLRAWAER